MSWRKQFNGLADSPKVFALSRDLGVEHLIAYALVNCLYEFAQPRGGHLNRQFLDCFEERARWTGPRGVVVDALYRVGFLDPETSAGTDVHDYVSMQGAYAEAMRKRSQRAGQAKVASKELSDSPAAVKKRRQRARKKTGDTGTGTSLSPETGGTCPPYKPAIVPPVSPPQDQHETGSVGHLAQKYGGDNTRPGQSPLDQIRSERESSSSETPQAAAPLLLSEAELRAIEEELVGSVEGASAPTAAPVDDDDCAAAPVEAQVEGPAEGTAAWYIEQVAKIGRRAAAESATQDEAPADAPPPAAKLAQVGSKNDPWLKYAGGSFTPPASAEEVFGLDAALAWGQRQGLSLAMRSDLGKQFTLAKITWGEWQAAWKAARGAGKSVAYVVTTALQKRRERPRGPLVVPAEFAATLEAMGRDREFWTVPSTSKVRAIYSRTDSMHRVREAFDAAHDWDDVIARLSVRRAVQRAERGDDDLGGLEPAFEEVAG